MLSDGLFSQANAFFSGPETSPYLLDFDCCIVLEALSNILASQVSPEDFLDLYRCPFLYLFLLRFVIFELDLCLVFETWFARMARIETQPLFSLGNIDNVAIL